MIIAVVIVGVIISMSQTILDVVSTPAGTTFPLVHNYAQDYYYYLHLMRQGFDGAWLATSKLTPEVFPPQFVNPFFLFLGHVSRIFSLSLPLVYTLARVGGGVLIIVLSFVLATKVYPASALKRTASILLLIFGSFWWGWGPAGPTVPSLVHLWTELDPMVRLSFIPHHLWSKVLMLATFLVIIRSWENTIRIKWIALAALGTLAAGFASPVVLVTIVPTLVLFLVLQKKTFSWRHYVPIVTAIMVGILVVFYHRRVELGVFPWTSYKPWEDAVRFSIRPIDYAQSLGPTFVLFLISLGRLWQTRTETCLPAGRLLIAWAFSGWLMAFFVGGFIPLWNIRYLEGYQFIPIAVGAAEAIGRRVIGILLVGIIIIHGSIGFIASWNEHKAYLASDVGNPMVYVPAATIAALTFLGKQNSDEVILAPFDIGSMIPAYSKLRVVGGHNLMTLHVSEKRAFIDRFYSLTNPDAIIKQLQSFSIVYLWRPKYVTFPYETIDGVTKVFDSGIVAIYRVR